MILLIFKNKYESVLETFNSRLKELKSIFEGSWEKFHGYQKIFGEQRDGRLIEVFKQEKDVKLKPLDLLGELVDTTASTIDAELTLSKSLMANDQLYSLEVQGEQFGKFTASQLHSLYRLLVREDMRLVYEAVPVHYPRQEWLHTDQEGIMEMIPQTIASPVKKFIPDVDSRILPTLDPHGDIPLIDMNNVEVLNCKVFSGNLPQSYKSQIENRRQVFIQAVKDALDNASVFEIETEEPVGKKIMNYIHFGDPKGAEYPLF